MNMDMQDTLACRRAYIDAYVISIWIKLLINKFFLLIDKLHTGCNFILRQVKKLCNMAFRNHHSMTRTNCVAITTTVRKFIF